MVSSLPKWENCHKELVRVNPLSTFYVYIQSRFFIAESWDPFDMDGGSVQGGHYLEAHIFSSLFIYLHSLKST